MQEDQLSREDVFPFLDLAGSLVDYIALDLSKAKAPRAVADPYREGSEEDGEDGEGCAPRNITS